jgi:hypothetical protein
MIKSASRTTSTKFKKAKKPLVECTEGRKNMATRKLMITALCISLLVFLSIIHPVGAEVKPTLYIAPAKIAVPVCTEFQIEVRIRNVGDRGLKSYSISVFYNKNQLTPITGELGDFLGGNGTIESDPAGFVTGTQIHRMPDGFSTEGGLLFRLTFHCKAVGKSQLAFSTLLPPPHLVLIDKNDVVYVPDANFDIENAKVTQYGGNANATLGGFSISVDKSDSAAPYNGSASAILVASVATATTVIYFKRVKHRKAKQ